MKQIDLIGSFEKRDFPQFRNPTIDTMIWGRQRHHVPILLEIDVTEARAAIHHHKAKTGQGISFTGGIAKRPGVIDEQIVVREYVGMTVMFDHDVTDGAPLDRICQSNK